MNQTVQIGPLALSLGVVIAFAALTLGWFVAERAAGRDRAIEPLIYVLLAAGLLGARIAFVLSHWPGYAEAPLSALDVRDGGWDPLAGVVTAAAAVALVAWRRRAAWPPLALGLATAAGTWLAAGWIAAALQDSRPPLPALTLAGLDGQPVALDSFRGRPLVVNLWATWCPPCVRELPVLVQAQRQRADVQFVFVNQAETAARVSAFLAGRGLQPRNVLLDADGQTARALAARALPTTFFFDAEGRLVAARVGELSAGTLAARLEDLAGPPRRAAP